MNDWNRKFKDQMLKLGLESKVFDITVESLTVKDRNNWNANEDESIWKRKSSMRDEISRLYSKVGVNGFESRVCTFFESLAVFDSSFLDMELGKKMHIFRNGPFTFSELSIFTKFLIFLQLKRSNGKKLADFYLWPLKFQNINNSQP